MSVAGAYAVDRLSALDASFHAHETLGPHLVAEIGAVMFFAGPPPDPAAVLDHLRERLDRLPRFRQRVVRSPLRLGRPFWIDDPDFSFERHVVVERLPAGGGKPALEALTSRVFSERFDKRHPLWGLWVVPDQLEDGRWAMVYKCHHSLTDGHGFMHVAAVLFGEGEPAAPRRRAGAGAQPGRLGLVLRDAVDGARLAWHALHSGALRRLPGHVRGVAGLVRTVVRGKRAPRVTLNGPIGARREVAIAHTELGDFKLVARAFGGTVNDIYLSVVAGALGQWLEARGELEPGLRLSALIPVNVRRADEHDALGARLDGIPAPLPVDERDPVERLARVAHATARMKAAPPGTRGAEALARLEEALPPALLAPSTMLTFTTRSFNTVVSNVRGSRDPHSICGRAFEEIAPINFLARDHRVTSMMMSWGDRVVTTFNVDAASVDPGAAWIIAAFERSWEELVTAARAAAGATPAAPIAARRSG
jgi:WS/DGAT/MGAT family acyltransferase